MIEPLDRRIRIETKTVSRDETTGTPVETWATYWECWANVQEVLPSKGESASNDMRIASRPARIRTRYVTGITAEMRVVYLDRDNRAMKILTPPVELGHRIGLEFMVADYSTSGSAA